MNLKLFNHGHSNLLIVAIEFKALVLIIFIFIMFFFTGLNIQKPYHSYEAVNSEIYTDKEIYNIHDTVTIQGWIKIYSSSQEIVIQICVFDWSNGSTSLLIDTKKRVSYDKAIYLSELKDGDPIQWICNKTGEFEILIHLKNENEASFLNVSFLKARFMVIEDKVFADIYTDRLIYLESQNVHIYGRILSSEYFENVTIEITVNKGSNFIKKLYKECHNLNAGNEIFFNCSFDSSYIEGTIHIYLKIYLKNQSIMDVITKFTKIKVRNRASINFLINNLITKYEPIQQYNDFLMVICDIDHFIFNFTNKDKHLLENLIAGYLKLTEIEKDALFILPSFGSSYLTTGDLIYWLMTDFAEETGLGLNDTSVFLSYTAVFDDFFIRDVNNERSWETYAWDSRIDRLLDWIKEYIIEQGQFFGAERLREIARINGVCGLMQTIYPNLCERFGDRQYQLIPIEAYEKVKKWAETSVYYSKTIKELMMESLPPRSLDNLEKIMWSEIISEYGSSQSNPTTVGFYESQVNLMLSGEKFPSNCETVARLVALIGRSLGMPIGIINPSETTSHWGNFQIHDGKIVPDTPSQNMFNKDKLSFKEKFIIIWPSLHYYCLRGYGVDQLYRDEFSEQLPEFFSEMSIEIFVPVISLELVDPIRHPIIISGSLSLFDKHLAKDGYLVSYIDGELRGGGKINSTSNFLIQIYINEFPCKHKIKFELFYNETWYSSFEEIEFTKSNNISQRIDLHFRARSL